MGREFEVKWIRHDEPIPAGWELAANEGRVNDHHGFYGRMVVREVVEEPAE
jgi:hypothetical protein